MKKARERQRKGGEGVMRREKRYLSVEGRARGCSRVAYTGGNRLTHGGEATRGAAHVPHPSQAQRVREGARGGAGKVEESSN